MTGRCVCWPRVWWLGLQLVLVTLVGFYVCASLWPVSTMIFHCRRLEAPCVEICKESKWLEGYPCVQKALYLMYDNKREILCVPNLICKSSGHAQERILQWYVFGKARPDLKSPRIWTGVSDVWYLTKNKQKCTYSNDTLIRLVDVVYLLNSPLIKSRFSYDYESSEQS